MSQRDDVPLTSYVFWFTTFCANSVFMTVVNKVLMKDVGAPYILLGLQQIVATTVYIILHVLIGRHDEKSVWHIKPITFMQVRRLLVVGINFTFVMSTSMMALRTVSVATVVVFRNLCTCMVALVEHLLLGESFGLRSWLAMLLTLIGSVVYAGNDISFDAVGYLWQVANSAVFCFGQLYEKWNMTRTDDQTAVGVAFIKAVVTLPVATALVLALGELESFPELTKISVKTMALILLTGVGAIGMGLIYMTLYVIATATASTVAGNFNKVASIIVGSWIFADTLNLMQSVGLALCVGGSFWWSMESVWRKSAKKSQ